MDIIINNNNCMLQTRIEILSHTINKSPTSAALEVVQIHPHLKDCHMGPGDCHRGCHRVRAGSGQGYRGHRSW